MNLICKSMMWWSSRKNLTRQNKSWCVASLIWQNVESVHVRLIKTWLWWSFPPLSFMYLWNLSPCLMNKHTHTHTHTHLSFVSHLSPLYSCWQLLLQFQHWIFLNGVWLWLWLGQSFLFLCFVCRTSLRGQSNAPSSCCWRLCSRRSSSGFHSSAEGAESSPQLLT